jgi:hypothetical protein
MWKEVSVLGYKVIVKIFEKGSRYGIKEFPRISKLQIYKRGKELAAYDRGWDFNELPPMIYKAIITCLKAIL